MTNEVLNLPEDLNIAIAERNQHVEFFSAVSKSLPPGTLSFLEADIVTRLRRINLLNGYLAGRGVDINTLPGMVEPGEEAKKLIKEADEKAKEKPASNVRKMTPRKRGGK